MKASESLDAQHQKAMNASTTKAQPTTANPRVPSKGDGQLDVKSVQRLQNLKGNGHVVKLLASGAKNVPEGTQAPKKPQFERRNDILRQKIKERFGVVVGPDEDPVEVGNQLMKGVIQAKKDALPKGGSLIGGPWLSYRVVLDTYKTILREIEVAPWRVADAIGTFGIDTYTSIHSPSELENIDQKVESYIQKGYVPPGEILDYREVVPLVIALTERNITGFVLRLDGRLYDTWGGMAAPLPIDNLKVLGHVSKDKTTGRLEGDSYEFRDVVQKSADFKWREPIHSVYKKMKTYLRNQLNIIAIEQHDGRLFYDAQGNLDYDGINDFTIKFYYTDDDIINGPKP